MTSSVRKRLDSADDDLESYTKNLTKAKKSLEEAEEAADALKLVFAKAKEIIDSSAGDSDLQSKLAKETDEKKRLEKELAELREKSTGGGSTSDSAVKDLKKKIKDLECQVEELETQLKTEKKKGGGKPHPASEDTITKMKQGLAQAKEAQEEAESKLTKIRKDIIELKKSGVSGDSTSAPASSQSSVSPAPLDLRKEYQINWHDIELGKRLAGGGFAEVYQGTYFGEPVAVKKLISQDNAQGARELMDEVNILTKLHSGFVIQLYGACFQPPHLCIVMELISKGSLGYLLWDKEQKLSWDQKWNFIRDGVLAMNYLHAKTPPILHRDLKAGNFLLTNAGRLKLTDFGTSIEKGNEKKNKDGEEQQFLGGTLNWTAPEVLNGGEYTEAADVYSYAMVMFEIATREAPWADMNSPQEQLKLKQKVCKGERPRVPSDVPEDMKTMMEMAWEHEVSDRASFDKLMKYLKKKKKLAFEEEEEDGGGSAAEKRRKKRGGDGDEAELKIQKEMREKAEERVIEVERLLEREKKKSQQTTSELDEQKSKVASLETMKTQMDRMREETETRLKKQVETAEKDKVAAEDKLKKELRKLAKLEKQKEELEKEKEDLEKELTAEKRKARDRT